MLPASRRILRLCLLALIASGTSFSLPALAAERSIGIEEIIVTARKREESVQDVPVAMTALTEEITDASVRDLADLNAYLPNVIIEDSQARSRSSSINIRGISYTESDKSFDPPVAVVLDGVFIGTSSGQLIENFDVERIEVLRGPQGTLFGKNTVGGVISAVRSRPTGEAGAKVQLTGGKWGQQEIRAVGNLPQVGEMLSTKLFYTMIKSDGYMDNTFLGSEGPEKDYQNFGASFLFEPGERFEALLTVETYVDDSHIGAAKNGNDPGFLWCDLWGACRTPSTGEFDYSTERDNTAEYDTDAVTLTMKYDINDNMQLVSVTGWRDETEDYISDLDGTSLPSIWIDNDNTHEQKSQEIRLEASYEKFNFVVGGYFWDNNYTQNWVTHGESGPGGIPSFWSLIRPGFATNADSGIPFADLGVNLPGNAGVVDLCLLEIESDPRVGSTRCDQSVGLGSSGLGTDFTQLLFQEQDVNSQAIFFQGDYDVTEKWTVTLGLRWTREEKEFVGAQSYLAPVSSVGLPATVWAQNLAGEFDAADLSEVWKETSPKVGVSYRLNDDVMFYASYSEGFHSGGYFGRNQNTKDFANSYEPEFAESWELGMKSQFFDNTVQLNAAIFYNDFEGKQESTVQLDTSTDTVVTVIDNVGSVEYFGAELEARWVVNENFNMFASLGYLDAEYKDLCIDLDGDQPAVGTPTSDCGLVENVGSSGGQTIWRAPQDESSLTPRFAPELTFGIGGTYSIPIGPGMLDLHARFNMIDDQETRLDNAAGSKLDSADFLNASASYTWDRYRITAFGRNLTDEVRENDQPIATVFQRSYIEPGTSWGIQIEADFGN